MPIKLLLGLTSADRQWPVDSAAERVYLVCFYIRGNSRMKPWSSGFMKYRRSGILDISVILPIYNNGKYIERAVNSVMNLF